MSNPPRPRSANVAVDGARIRKLRQDAGRNMTELAAKAQISRPYLSLIENARRKTISPRVFASIADALGVAVDDIRQAA